MKKFDVMAAGHLCLDLIPAFPDSDCDNLLDVMSPGKLVNVNAPTLGTGGSVSNTGIAMKMLGCETCFCARVGEDDFGKVTISFLSKRGNAKGIKIIPGLASSYSIVIAPPNIDRIFLHCPGTNDSFAAIDIDTDLLKECRLFHFGYPPLMKSMFENEGEEMLRIFKLAKECGAITSCDMALPDPNSPSGQAPWRRILEKVLPYVDIFLPSVEEALYCLEPETFNEMKNKHGNVELIDFLTPNDYSRIAKIILNLGAKMTALKSGHQGWYFKTGTENAIKTVNEINEESCSSWSNRELWSPVFEVDRIKSATGAGDSSIAGFLSALLHGLDIEESLKCASCLGWQNLRSMDSLGGIESWENTLTLTKQLKTKPIELNEDWLWDHEHQIYLGPEDRRKITIF